MRVTQNMLAKNTLTQIQKSYQRLDTQYSQLNSGKKITRASQDPVVAVKGMYYRTDLIETEQFQRNLSELQAWNESSEAALEQTRNNIHRANELLLAGKNDTMTQLDREAIAKELGQIINDIADAANTRVAGKYIFNGTAINVPPVNGATSPPTVSIDTDGMLMEVSKSILFRANIKAENVFTPDLFKNLTDLKTEFEKPAPSHTVLNTLMVSLNTDMNNVLKETSELGARAQRIDLIQTRLGSQEITGKKIMSENEDVDMEKVITDLKMQESVHRSALSVGARLIQPTILDFLR